MRSLRLFPALLLATLGLLAPIFAVAQGTSVRAILVVASNQPGGADARLAPYESTLRRILRFESYRFVGEGSATLASPGQASLSIGQGHRLELTSEKAQGPSPRIAVNWTHSGKTLMNTGLQLRPGVPAVLGGPAAGEKGEAYAVIFIAN